MTMYNKIFQTLVVEGKQRTAAQLAAQLNTTPNSVAARVSEIRDAGYAIYSNACTDTAGRTKYFYRHGAPSRKMVAAGREAKKLLRELFV